MSRRPRRVGVEAVRLAPVDGADLDVGRGRADVVNGDRSRPFLADHLDTDRHDPEPGGGERQPAAIASFADSTMRMGASSAVGVLCRSRAIPDAILGEGA